MMAVKEPHEYLSQSQQLKIPNASSCVSDSVPDAAQKDQLQQLTLLLVPLRFIAAASMLLLLLVLLVVLLLVVLLVLPLLLQLPQLCVWVVVVLSVAVTVMTVTAVTAVQRLIIVI
jgi:hypothetical protein